MNTSQYWFEHFEKNLKIGRINWETPYKLEENERAKIIKSLQAWQLGETSEGLNLLKAAKKYAAQNNDFIYPKAIELFIKEEQKHGNNLGKYLDLISEKRILNDWGDTLFRKIRHFNSNMELWTLTVITVESTAQIFYQSLKDATDCPLLTQICTDILIDEAYHVEFQKQRMLMIFEQKNNFSKFISYYFYKIFYFSTILTVWFAHKKVFVAGGNSFSKYFNKMKLKFDKTLGKVKKQANKSSFVVINRQLSENQLQ